MLRPDQQIRYARHLSLPGFGSEAQERLLAGSVLLVGAGGLGSPAALYLAAAGVGRLVIVDDDRVDLTNLQRQVLYNTAGQGKPKAESAREALTSLNRDVEVEAVNERFAEKNARDLVRSCDIVLDGADNFPTRYLINDAAYLEKRPVVHGSIHLFEGQCTVFARDRGPCYRCLFPSPPPPGAVPSCAEAGVLGVLPGMIGVAQATEAIKLLTGLGDPLVGKLLMYDALAMQFRTLQIKRRPECPLCGDSPSITEAQTIAFSCPTAEAPEIEVSDLQPLQAEEQPCHLLDVREAREVALGMIPGSTHIPLGELEDRMAEVTPWRDEQVICICQVGQRSLRAAALLQHNGFGQAVSLRGGYAAWLMTQLRENGS
ncbi:MAG: molybdopterin-synthase adenylyltransferase MoeB [Kiritimatiellia bacterium]|jgi:adenylyltransferase/sulfurtransferase|nr:molybdopterin-synthase adenylyltransferase MoeB [Kiritimatiellia bacterium]MDP6631070.1 molybdopterin-synthase adenylyltransferase MoeB [Kiritimatiellia bacterium]MDP6810026.1 molybdopterin-synthase adenylyltransferase MoeB [Kiritimatiellia bacterium]MDP7024797.1 molybdopterin-synthase adenylyltransferase MoeB [Kiritimatiellia bacterium]